MKKSLIIILLAILSSCEKEECNCGVIANDGIEQGCYYLEIRNGCSGNIKRFCFEQDVWLNNYVGDDFCVTNEPAW